ncbi:hypothetical protein Sste5346_007630 [Sporothrix stenoceras]|uniref:Zn(2)-C6 fungal-type domain-containing protein n=1 Tax=Sporothrix stenoceras TaxID=5173 RepID=A0ABR3YUT2_9PEZI
MASNPPAHIPPASASAPSSSAPPDSSSAADSSAPRRGRASRPKVKTGCKVCKERRIKCDEKRPSCSQCERSKKVCTGYPPPPRSSRPFEEIAIAPRPALAPGPGPALAPAPLAPRPLAPLASGPAPLAAAPRPYLPPGPGPTYTQPIRQSIQPHPQHPQPPQPHLLPQQPLQPRFISNPQSHFPIPPSQSQPQSQSKPAQSASRQLQTTQRRVQKLQQRRNVPPNIPIAAMTTMSGYTIQYHPSINLPLTEREGLYFQLFRLQTASELSGFFDDVFWTRLVLAECHSEAAIRHATVALGALYKTLETTTESPPTSPADPSYNNHDTAREHWQVALKQYSEACRELRTIGGEDERAQRTRLMATVLLACFDSFIGHHKHAIVTIQSGLALLNQLRVDRRRALADPSTASEPVESELTQMFTRLAIQAKSYDMAFHFPQPYVVQLMSTGKPAASPGNPATSTSVEPSGATPDSATSPPAAAPSNEPPPLPTSTHQNPIPAQFTTLREARLSWDTLLEHIFRYMEMMLQLAKGPPNLLPSSMKSHGTRFAAYMEAWSNAFEPLLINRHRPGVSTQEKCGIAVLKMFQIMGVILYVMTFSDSEMMFDSYQQQFKEIVDLASEVVGDEERRAAAARCPDPTKCVHDFHSNHPPPTGGSNNSQGDYDTRHGFEYRTSHIKASFSTDLGIVPPLYVVATKSRDRVLRRQAIQLLRSSSRREGMWDSELAARIAMWVVDIEEEGEEDEFYEALQRYGHVGGAGSVPSGITEDSIVTLSADSLLLLQGQHGLEQQRPQPQPIQPEQAQPPSRGSSVDFGTVPLGPGGNARWDMRRASQASVLHTTSGASSHSSSTASPQDLHASLASLNSQGSSNLSSPPLQSPLVAVPAAAAPVGAPPTAHVVTAFSYITAPLDPSLPYYMQTQHPIPAEKRVLVKACEFDLREHTATLKCGTRGLAKDALDAKTRQTQIRW